jgi:3-oxoacyl-(acyl-carrier-protein) synthase
MNPKLVIVAAARVDAETENVVATKNSNGTWIRLLPHDFSTMSEMVIKQIPDQVGSHINTGIICSVADDSHARERLVFSERCRPRDILNALGINLTKTLVENFKNIDNIFKVDAACASGLLAIEVASFHKNLSNGVILIIGVEKPTSKSFTSYFRHLGAVAENTEFPYTSFDDRRSGFVMADGAAVIAVATEEYAVKHNLKIIATIDNIETKTILTHVTSPSDTQILTEFIKTVIADSKKSINNISWWNAHATATPFGDEIEYEIFNNIFSDSSAVISSHKGIAGHCMSASALVELAAAIESVSKGIASKTSYLDNEHKINNDPKIIVEDTKIDTKTFIKTSFGFGGRNGVAVVTVV